MDWRYLSDNLLGIRRKPKCKDDLDQRDNNKLTRSNCVSFGVFSCYSRKDAKGYHKEF